MAHIWMKGLGMLAAAGVLATGCAPATVDGTVGDREFDRIGTAFFDVYDDGYGGQIPVFYLYDYKWTCEELQDADENDTELATEDPNQVVGGLSFMLAQFDEEEFDLVGPSGPGTFKVFDADNFSDYQNVNNGDLLAVGGVFFGNYSDTINESDSAENGTVTIDELDLTSQISGTFDIFLEASGEQLTGRFSVELCDL